MSTWKLPPAFFVMTVLFSCSQAKPEIRYGSLELVNYENGGNPVERLTFFVLPSDGDGMEDLEELWLYHDWEGLSWQLKSGDWVETTINGQVWIGSRAIAMQDGSPLPRGQYRAVLFDKGGESGERSFTFDAPPRKTFPSFSISANRYSITSDYPQQNLIVYDDGGNYLVTIRPPQRAGNVSELGLPAQARSIALWAFDPEHSTSAFTDVVPLND